MNLLQTGEFSYETSAIIWIILFPLFGAIFNGLIMPIARVKWRILFDKELGKLPVSVVAPLAIFIPFMMSVGIFIRSLTLGVPHDKSFQFTQTVINWLTVGSLKIDFAFVIDPLSMIMTLVVTGVSFVIHVYSIGYMADDPSYSRYFSYLNLFVFSMLLLVLGDNLVTMFIGWEGVGLCSYLLIGFWFEDVDKAKAGLKAFVTNRIGDFGFLLGIFLIFFYTQTVNFGEINERISLIPAAAITSIALLLFLGATGKSAQIPLYVWLPDAMAGPTPVSALIHAATMVTAGVYMIARMNFLYILSPAAMTVVAIIGALTALFAATMGVLQNDIKKVLAYSTISQLGFMFVAVGVGAFWVGIFHLVTHAFFKACLFLGAGSVIVGMHHEQDMRLMGGLRKLMPITAITYLIAALAIAGIPPFAGFFSKDEILWKAFSAEYLLIPGWALWAVLTPAALLTAFYMFRSYYLTFSGESRADEVTKSHVKESPVAMTAVLVLLAGLATVAGVIGWPHILSTESLHIPNWFEGYTSGVFSASTAKLPVVEYSGAAEFGLMVFSVVVGALGILAARALYKDAESEAPERMKDAWATLYNIVYHKYYIDEIYNAAVIQPIRLLSEWLWKFADEGVIDTVFVNGSAFATRGFGHLLRLWQNGDLQRYLVTFGAGVAVILLIVFG
ncbi:MAG: NADH-quinone oxidoreductase subunit L [Myxococcota bacterium]